MGTIRHTRTYRGPEEHALSRRLRRFLTFLVVFLAFHHALSFFLISSVRVGGEGMLPELARDDRVFVSQAAYGVPVPLTRSRIGMATPDRGDVVLYEPPFARRPPFALRAADQVVRFISAQRLGLLNAFGEAWEGSETIGRVVAMPGDTVSMDEYYISVITPGGQRVRDIDERDGSVRVIRPQAPDGFPDSAPLTGFMQPRVLGEDEYWIVGDNRGARLSSLHFGPVSATDIRARVTFRFFPLPRFGGVR